MMSDQAIFLGSICKRQSSYIKKEVILGPFQSRLLMLESHGKQLEDPGS